MTHTSTPKRRSFLNRIVGAAAMRADVYEEVEADRSSTGQAIVVVMLSSVAAGIGMRGFGGGGVGDVVFFSAVALMAWVAWTFVVYAIGASLLPEPQTRASIGELLRTTGFATAPGMLRVAGIWPGAARLVFAIASVWMLLAMIVAVRQALEFTTTSRAVGVCVLGWVLAIAIAVGFGFFFGPTVS